MEKIIFKRGYFTNKKGELIIFHTYNNRPVSYSVANLQFVTADDIKSNYSNSLIESLIDEGLIFHGDV